jgi:hypothetical protein
MDRTTIHRGLRGVWLTMLVAAGLALGSGSALAAHQVSHTGTTGTYSFNDTAGHPAGRCSYEGAAGSRYFDALKVLAPEVFYPDLHPAKTDHGVISWVVRLQNSVGGWHTVKTSSETFSPATDSSPATFTAKKIKWPGPFDGGSWRAQVVLTWFTPGALTIGRAVVQIDHYHRSWDDSVGSSCKGHVVVVP